MIDKVTKFSFIILNDRAHYIYIYIYTHTHTHTIILKISCSKNVLILK